MPFGYRRRAVARDVAALAAVPALLVAAHVLLPFRVRAALALSYESPAPASFLTAAYIHTDASHLLANVVGYCIGVTFAYGLCLQARRRRWFHATSVWLFAAVPTAVNAASYALVAARRPDVDATGFGFSGVVSGFGGFVFVALLVFLRTRHSRDAVVSVALLLATLLFLAFDAVYAGRLRPLPVALALVAVGVAGYGLRDAPLAAPAARADAVVVGLVAVVLLVFLRNLFPADVVRDGAVVNVFAHATGFLLGAAGAVACLRATSGESA